MNSRKLATTLIILFLAGLTGCTIYARGFYQYRKPLVTLAVSEQGRFSFSFASQGTVEISKDTEQSKGYQYLTTVTINKSELAADAFFMYEEDPVDVVMPAKRFSATVGEILAIRYNGDDIIISIGMNNQLELDEGETTEVTLNKTSIELDCIIPKSALFTDYDGTLYVYFVLPQDGLWGTEYILKRSNVKIWADSAYGEVAVQRYLPFDYPVVSSYDKPLADGMKVRFY